jgi:hypothetical protein
MVLENLASRLDTWNGSRKMRSVRTGWAARTRADIHFRMEKGVQFRYRDAGDGRPIVFAADPPATLELYDELLDVFAQRFHVIVPELPAMGFSAAQSGLDFHFTPMNDTVIAFLESILMERAILAFSCVAGLGAVTLPVDGRIWCLISSCFKPRPGTRRCDGRRTAIAIRRACWPRHSSANW